ncbi:MAG: porin [Alphaproteobacteria bacterium]|nr:porin [Alphaproteobacteria bacterium]
MVKILLKTSTLAGLALYALTSVPSYGETLTTGATAPSLKIDGYTAVNSYFVNQQRRENGKGGPQPHLGVDASNLFFTILGTSATGMEYMFRVTLETIPGSDSIIDQNYVQLKGKFGSFQAGDVAGPGNTMIWDAGRIIGGTGGFDGGFNNVYNMSAGVIRGNDNIGDTGNTTKITYYSPEVAGWQVGVAYTPSTAHRGDNKVDNRTALGSSLGKIPGNRGLYDTSATYQPFDLRNVALGLTYQKEIGKWNITLSGVGMTAKSYFYDRNFTSGGRVPMQNTKSYQLGFVMGYNDFRFGAGYLDNGKSHLPRTPNFMINPIGGTNAVNLGSMNNGNAGHAWNVGAGYTMGAYQFAASYQRTNRNTGNLLKANSDFYTATVDVTPLQGFKVYTEVDYIRSRTNAVAVQRENGLLLNSSKPWNVGIGNNAGLIAIAGTKLSF